MHHAAYVQILILYRIVLILGHTWENILIRSFPLTVLVTVRQAINHLLDYRHVSSVVLAVVLNFPTTIFMMPIMVLQHTTQDLLLATVFKATSVQLVMIIMVHVRNVLLALQL